ncbi:MAG: Rieske (2Fe-2S) protein [Chlorobi bacterium]|nr:Rieske (2Fe-2S) protein [Chlorobiota bacterium]
MNNSSLSAPSSDARTITISLDELRQHQRVLAERDGHAVLVIMTSYGIVALDPTCPHQHTRSLGEGVIKDDTIACPNHGWTFSLLTGKALRGSGCIRLYPVRITDTMVIVELPNDQPRWMQY